MQIIPLYPTLIYCNHVNNFEKNQADLFKVYETLNKSNRLAQKRPNEHLVSDPSFSKNLIQEFNLIDFQQEIISNASRYMNEIGNNTSNFDFDIFESWMTVTHKGQFSPRHEHGAADISGTFYLQTDNTDGQIYFSTPVKQCQSSRCFSGTHPDLSLPPSDGMIVLFPGWLEHGVSCQTTDSTRIGIAFNISVKKHKDF